MFKRSAILILSVLALITAAIGITAQTPTTVESAQNKAVLLTIDGAIGPAIYDYIKRGIKQAGAENARVVILQMDTPGGLDKSMRAIVQDILASPVPVVTYVAPSGARAASAGTYILYASHIAAMAPGTNLGAATPVAIGTPGAAKKDQEKGEKPAKTAMEKKVTEDASAYIRSLAQLRGRNVKWAEQAVLEAKSLSATEALKMNVIDVIANNIPALLKKINGKNVLVQDQVQTINTVDTTVQKVDPDWRTRFLAIITDPSVAYLLLIAGIWGLFFEFSNPGLGAPGVLGGIAILVALYAFQLLPINYVGLALLLFGVGLMVAEAFLPSFGIIGLGGIASFAIGSIMLLETDIPGFSIALPIILGVSIATAGFFLIIINMAMRSRFRPKVSGAEEMVGTQATVVDINQQTGELTVRTHGELWRAKTESTVKVGDKVKVTALTGLVLTVE